MSSERRLSYRKITARVWHRFLNHRVTDHAAKLAFYFFLSLFPFLLFLIALVGALLRSVEPVSDALKNYLGAIIPPSASQLLDKTLHEISHGPTGAKLSFGLVLALLAASKGMMALIDTLNLVYSVKERRPWWKRRALGLGLTIVSVSLVIAAFALILYGARLVTFPTGHFGETLVTLWPALKWLVLLALMLLALNVIYVYAPNVKHRRWHWVMPGNVAALLLWLAGSYGFKLYLHFFNHYRVTYGSIGAVIVLLLWFYITGIAILVGAELNSEIESSAEGIEEGVS